MGQSLTVYKRNGQVRYELDSYTHFCSVKSAEQKCELLGVDTVTIKLESAEPLEFVVGDYTEVFGSVYTLNKFDEPVKTGERKFETTLLFEGLQYKLLNAIYRSADAQGYNPSAEFSLVADMRMAVQVLLQNVNRVGASIGETWELGECINTEFKEYSFSNENCLEVLQRLCQDNECEFEITVPSAKRYVLNIKSKVGNLFPAVFSFGKGGGIYKLSRKNINNGDVISRLYVEGGTQNITSKYRNGALRLRLPASQNAESYVESQTAINAFGIKEGSRTYEDIFPTRKATVTAVVEGDVLSFIDDTMFDLNEKYTDGDAKGNTKWLIDGTAAKVKFTGNHNLAGYTFDIAKYDHATHKFTLNYYEDKRGMKYPSATSPAYQIEVGAEYVLLDIVMPDDPYVVDAEARLLEKAQADIEADSQPKVQYELEIESMALEKAYGSAMGIVNVFQLGDLLHVKDEDINVDKAIRITGFTRDCYSKPYKYKLQLSDTVNVTLIETILEDINKTQMDITRLNNTTSVEIMRANWKTTQELLGMVFDGDGYFNSENIRPASIETLMLSVGNRAGQFVLQDVVLTANALVNGTPNKNVFTVTSGNTPRLIHYAIEDSIRTWTLRTSFVINLSNNGAMYVYAKCPKATAGTTFDVVLSQNKFATEVGEYYYFLIGVLSSVFNGYRELTTMYGHTRITGRCINCGRIESADKRTYFDLDNGEIAGNIKFISSSGDITSVADLEQFVNGQDDVLQQLNELLGGLQTQVDGTIEYWYGTGTPTLDNVPANQWDDRTKPLHIGDVYTDTSNGKEYVFSQQGEDIVWVEQQPTGVGLALQQAYNAYNMAGSKSHVYVTANASTPPAATYKQGDLWVMLDTMKIQICITDCSGEFNSADWGDAGYSNDAKALEALQKLTDLAADSIITPAEKIVLKQEIANIQADYSVVKAKAQLLNVETAAFDAAYTALRVYCATILSNMTTNTTNVNKTTYTQKFTNYYTARTNILTAISNAYTDNGISGINTALDELRDTLEMLQEQIDGTIEYWYGNVVPTLNNYPASQWTDEPTRSEHIGDMYTDTNSGLEYRFVCESGVFGWLNVASSGIGQAIQTANDALGVANGKNHTFVTSSFADTLPTTYKKGDMWIALDCLQIRICKTDCAGTFRTADWEDIGYSDNADAEKALQELQAMADDSIITPTEKIALKQRYAEMAADYAELAAQAKILKVTVGELADIWAAIQRVVDGILEDMETSTEGIDRDSFNQYFSDYMTARNALLKRINDRYTDEAFDTLAELVDDLQAQVDGAIEYWYGTVAPTENNYPASSWNTAQKKSWHVGDIYTNTANGNEYKYSSTYNWVQQTATGVGKAITQAINALSTANGKNHVYVTASTATVPTRPYKVGDLWITTNNLEIRICTVARTSTQSYYASDWKKAGYATDDEMQFALTLLQDMGDDNVISPLEKVTLSARMAEIAADYAVCVAQAALTGADTTELDTAYSQLCEYLADLLDDMDESTQVDKDEYNRYFNSYYTARTQLINNVSFKYADNAVDGVVVGQGNYIKNSAYFENVDGWNVNPANDNDQPRLYTDTQLGNVMRYYKVSTARFWIMNTQMESKGGNVCLPNGRFIQGNTYTFAFWAKAGVACNVMAGFMDSTGNQAVIAPYRVFNIGTSWKRYIYTFTVASNANVTHEDIRLFMRQNAAADTLNNLYLTRFVLVEGNKAPEWAASGVEQEAKLKAQADLLKAIRDNYTQIEGGLILSTFLKLGALQQNGTWKESAGFKAMLANDNEIAAYFGGTYEEALEGTKQGMMIIYHNGKLKALNAEITGVINATNGTFSGTLNGVTGTFKTLNCTDANGNVKAAIGFSSSDGKMYFEGDMQHQGYDYNKQRGYRFLTSDLWCRGVFGAHERATVLVIGGKAYYYTKGMNVSNPSPIEVTMQNRYIDSGRNPKLTYHIDLVPATGDAAGFRVDLVIIKNSATYYYDFAPSIGKLFTVVNANDDQSAYILRMGEFKELKGGEAAMYVNVGGDNILPTSTNANKGLFCVCSYDNNW